VVQRIKVSKLALSVPLMPVQGAKDGMHAIETMLGILEICTRCVHVDVSNQGFKGFRVSFREVPMTLNLGDQLHVGTRGVRFSREAYPC
jgi:hypothetical protein